jgi:hypothetical protein
LQQPCSCCIAKRRECTFTDSKSVSAVKVTTPDVHETECIITPQTSSDIIFTPDDLIPPNPKSRTPEKHDPTRHPLDVSSNLCLTPPLDPSIVNQNWLGSTGQFVDQFSSSCLQDIFFDWNVPPGCNPLDFASTFSPIYASAETASLGVISDPTHILTPSAYLEPANAHQSAVELKRYRTFLVFHTSTLHLNFLSLPVDISVKIYSAFLPVLHSTWRKEGKSPLLLTFMQATGAYQVGTRESREFLRFAIEDMTPVLTREIVSGR